MKHPLAFNKVLDLLNEQRSLIIEQLKSSTDSVELVKTKTQIEYAINCLKLCEQLQIHPDSQGYLVPKSMDYFGNFVLVDVGEGVELNQSSVVQEDSIPFEIHQGDVIIKVQHPFNFLKTQDCVSGKIVTLTSK